MRKAEIYFNGEIVKVIEFDQIRSNTVEGCTELFVNDDDGYIKQSIAIIPNNHLIIFKD